MVRDSFGPGRPPGQAQDGNGFRPPGVIDQDPTIEGWTLAEGPGTPRHGVALIDASAPPLAWDYETLQNLARQRLGLLRAQGLSAGQLVAAPASSGLDLVLMQHALAQVPAALLPIDDEPGSSHLTKLLGATSAEWIWRPQGADRGDLMATGHQTARPSLGRPWPSPLALVVETSGSGGAPRAVMLSAANLRGSAARVNRHLALEAGDTWLCCLPLRHIGGLSIPYRCALAGAALVLHQGFQAEAVAADLERHAVTHLSLVPPMLARLLDLGRPPPPTLRVVLVGGQSLSTPLAARALAAGWPLYLSYGMTETASQVACSDRLTTPPAEGAVGPPLPGLEIDCPACPDPPSVLRVRGPTVMAGYANPRRLPGQGLEEGWLRTSDLACLDSAGVLHCLGRADDVLVTAGVKVHPARVEAVLAEAPGLGEVAVVGVPDAVWGQRLVALYTGAASPAELDAWCRDQLPRAERPRTFIQCPTLPSLHSGKLDRHRLQQLAVAQGAESGL